MTEPTTAPASSPDENQLRAEIVAELFAKLHDSQDAARAMDVVKPFIGELCGRVRYLSATLDLRTTFTADFRAIRACLRRVGDEGRDHVVTAVDRVCTELVTAREDLEALKRHEWFVGKAAESRTARTVAELTELLVAASSEWDDNTGDDETSRPYLEYLAKAIESWRPVPAEAAEPEGQNR